MKIGIITFHTAINFGGVLQAFALQEAIRKIGVSPEIINYHCPHFERQYNSVGGTPISKAKRIASAILKNGTLKRNINGFKRFSNDYLILSEEFNKDNIAEANNLFDVFITGSDQVWSPVCAGFDKHYFLDFVDDINKKNSYAASFGQAEIKDDLKKEYNKLLTGFNRISVREKSGVLLVKEITGKDCVCVLDPTFLLSKAEWNAYFQNVNYPKYDYALVYMIEEDKNLLNIAKKYAERNGIEVIYINDRVHKYSGVTNLRLVDPDEWVTLFYHAKKVFTNSFHGVAFSINFNVPFFVQYLPSNRKVGDRISNILEIFGLSDVMKKGLEDDYIFDFDKTNKKLSTLRIESINYLTSVVGSIDGE